MWSDELRDRTVAALVREWGVAEQDVRDAINRLSERERRLGPEVAQLHVWPGYRRSPMPRVIDLAAAEVGT